MAKLYETQINAQDQQTLESIRDFMADALFDPLADVYPDERKKRVADMIQSLMIFMVTFLEDCWQIDSKDTLDALAHNIREYYADQESK